MTGYRQRIREAGIIAATLGVALFVLRGSARNPGELSTLDKTPPELAADIMDRGIVLAGGGALLSGLDERLRHETQMPAQLAESPLTCVAVGSGRSLEVLEVMQKAAKSRSRSRNGYRR